MKEFDVTAETQRLSMKSLLTPLLIPALLCAQTPPAPSTQPIRSLYVADQRDRGVALADDGLSFLPQAEAIKLPKRDWPEINSRDAARQVEVRRMLDAGQLTTGEDFYDAAFMFQHGQKPADYLLAHVLASQSVLLGYARARWIAAATLDRYLLSVGQPQVYGTQFHDGRFAYYTQHKTDPNLSAELKAMSPEQAQAKSQQPYDETLLPDDLRRAVCVPPLAQQQQYVADANAGKKVDLPRLSACLR